MRSILDAALGELNGGWISIDRLRPPASGGGESENEQRDGETTTHMGSFTIL